MCVCVCVCVCDTARDLKNSSNAPAAGYHDTTIANVLQALRPLSPSLPFLPSV